MLLGFNIALQAILKLIEKNISSLQTKKLTIAFSFTETKSEQ